MAQKKHDKSLPLDGDRQAWERQSFESDVQWRAFRCYLDLPESGDSVQEKDRHGNMRDLFVPHLRAGESRTLRRAQEVYRGSALGADVTVKYPWTNCGTRGLGWPHRHKWRDRIESYDRFRHQAEISESIRNSQSSKLLRIRALEAGIATALKGLKNRNMGDENFRDVTIALDRLTARLSEEYDDTPTQHIQHTHTSANNLSGDLTKVLEKADTMSDSEIVEEYRKMKRASA